MGAPKPLLERDGETFLARAVRVLREGGCTAVVVVVGAADAAVRAAAEAAGARVVTNEHRDSEQVDSVRLALRHLDGAAAALVLPVDLPWVTSETVAAVVATWRRSGAPLVVPEHAGAAGHPLLVAQPLHAIVLETELPEGLQSLVLAHAAVLETVAVADAGILMDVDTPGDLRRHGLGV